MVGRDLALGFAAVAVIAAAINRTGGLPNSLAHLYYLPLLYLAFRVPAPVAYLGALLAGLLAVFEVAPSGLAVSGQQPWLVWPVMFLLVTVAAGRWAGTIRKQAEAERQLAREVRAANAELERRVTERTAQLEAANKELEAFAYSVSHDLRAPLRSIDGFSQAVLEDYAGRLDEQGREQLQRVRAAAQRMGLLIDDMLDLSRVARAEMRREEVDLSGIARAVAAELKNTAPERQAEFVIQDGLVASGDGNLLRAVIENLLGNAWKFTAPHQRARIEFGARRRDDGSVAYFVGDDGVGFDMAYVGKLFGAFQRLHPTSDFGGSGIGLATTQRIVHRHGGRVWAEGAVEQGATFYFTL